jgi:hypothetical protein
MYAITIPNINHEPRIEARFPDGDPSADMNRPLKRRAKARDRVNSRLLRSSRLNDEDLIRLVHPGVAYLVSRNLPETAR